MPESPSDLPRRIRVIVADDEPLARERLRHLLGLEPDIEIIAECPDGGVALESIRQTGPDAVFLDIRMPVLNGFEVVEKLAGEVSFGVIFVTAYDQYALKAFEAHAVDYLLKPFDSDRFQKALQRLRNKLKQHRISSDSDGVLEMVRSLKPEPSYPDRFAIKSGGRISVVQLGEVEWIKGAGNYAELHVGQKAHLLRRTLTKLEAELPKGVFMRISRSLLVNIGHVRGVRSKSHGDFLVLMQGGESLVGSRNYREFLHLSGVKRRTESSDD